MRDEHARMLAFLQTLLTRYLALGDQSAAAGIDPDTAARRLAELYLTEAAFRYTALDAPTQVVVLGPTQTGKSTIVNLLLGRRLAEVSPLAGFTVHPQGFWTLDGKPPADWLAALFPGRERREVDQLDRDPQHLDQYALTRPDWNGPRPDLPSCVLWDTPDFDSLAARGYQRGVCETAALADVHVFVLSKEKYADLSVWKMLRLLQPLGRPLVVCLNKMTSDAREPITAALRQRLGEIGYDLVQTPIVDIDYDSTLLNDTNIASRPERSALRGALISALSRIPKDKAVGVARLIRRRQDDWLAPIRAEQAALAEWEQLVNTTLNETAQAYKRDFLDHPQRFDTFRRATVELLHLLELPGVANVISKVRLTLSWPARQLFAARQAWSLKRLRRGGMTHGLGSEEVVLFEAIEKLLTSLARDASRRCEQSESGEPVWRLIARCLEQQAPALRQDFEAAARQQRADFAPVIHATANKLFDVLRNKPTLLNTLRAARVTTDLAAIALAVKTAGLGMNDLLFAPAMFALTSMLTEGALGTYMIRASDELKRKQFEHMKSRFIDAVCAKQLVDLVSDLKDETLFGVSAEQLRDAEQALQAWEAAR